MLHVCIPFQVVSPRAIQLDKLVTEMTEYYSDKENRELHQLDKVSSVNYYSWHVVIELFSQNTSWAQLKYMRQLL